MARRLSAILLLAVLGCKGKGGAEATKAPPPAPVKLGLEAAVEIDTPKQLVLTGIVAADQRAEVTADTAGKVIDVMVERGKKVKQGQEVVRLDVRSAALGAREAQANLAGARAQRALAEEECKRVKSLLDKGAITRSEYDRQMTQCTSALQSVSAAEARTQMMVKSVADGIVRAPFDGTIAQKSVAPGEWVAPGRPLFTLVDDDPMRIELSVPEAAVRAIDLNQRVELVAVSDPDRVIGATITRKGVEVGQSRSLIVEATIDKDSGLVPGMFAEARVTYDKIKRPVISPKALIQRGKQWHAYVAVKGVLEDRIVQVGPITDGKVAIAHGLVAGEKVVANVCEKDCACGYVFPPKPRPKTCDSDPRLIDGLRVE